MLVLIQYAFDDGEIHIYEPWLEPVWKTKQLLREFAECELIGFNLSFDVFHLAKLATVWELLPEDLVPITDIQAVVAVERAACLGPCWKPAKACDLMLHSRKGRYQTLMPRKPIRIRRVPAVIAEAVVTSLGQCLEFDKIFFAKTKTNPGMWAILPIEDRPDLVDLQLSFNPAAGLKFLAEYALDYVPKYHFSDVSLSSDLMPSELGYAPFADAAPEPEQAWPTKIAAHVEHWHNNEQARAYAYDDIVITRDLYKHFGEPIPGDDDSELACMVAVCRWRGFYVDLDKIQALLVEARKVVDASPININAPQQVKEYFFEALSEIEKVGFVGGCTKEALKFVVDSPDWSHNPAAKSRATELLEIKYAVKEVELYEKLLVSRRLHADLNVIGAKSGRMSGGGGLNVQGIKHTKAVRACFPLKDCEGGDLDMLSLGDFSAFEVCIADAVFNDPQMREDLIKDHSIHGEFGAMLFDKTYDEIIATKGSQNDLYTAAKSAFFASALYMGDEGTINRKQGVPIEKAREALHKLSQRYRVLAVERERIITQYSAMTQPGGLGTQVLWKEPIEFAETLFGFRRDFTLEWQICRQLYNLATNPPKEWKEISATVVRSKKPQKAHGAAQSALFGAAFGLQGANIRASANHKIQGTGAQVTKRVQCAVWALQPSGLHPWRVATLQVHDELLVCHKQTDTDLIRQIILDEVEIMRTTIPQLKIDWVKDAPDWSVK